MISMYSQDKGLTTYCQDCWWSDNWDPRDYGRDYDFNKPFFNQFYELKKTTPRLALLNTNGYNSEYCNYTTDNKNCYLVFGGDYNEDCYYSILNFHCKDSMDNCWVSNSELMYDCINSDKGYRILYSMHTGNCKDSYFLYDCASCEFCFGCIGLRNKKFHIFNQPYSEKDYHEKIKEFRMNTWSGVEYMKKEFEKFKLQFPHRATVNINVEKCSGNNIYNAKNCTNCYDTTGPCEDCKDCIIIADNAKDMLSTSYAGHKAELVYESLAIPNGNNIFFCDAAFSCNNSMYCNMITTSQNLFGCTSMKKAEYCILNKQYTKEEYKALVPKIIHHMKNTLYPYSTLHANPPLLDPPLEEEGEMSQNDREVEFGEFFPMQHSLFAFNETKAMDHFPLTKEEALSRGLQWKEDDAGINRDFNPTKIPDSIHDVTEDILTQTIICQETGKPFKIIPQELKLCKQLEIPIPRYAPETRNKHRLAKRLPFQLWQRSCLKCNTTIESCYSPGRPEIIYCQKCYISKVF
jgi:hypothetical protein